MTSGRCGSPACRSAALDCGSLTRVPVIVGAAPLLLLVLAGALILLIRGD